MYIYIYNKKNKHGQWDTLPLPSSSALAVCIGITNPFESLAIVSRFGRRNDSKTSAARPRTCRCKCRSLCCTCTCHYDEVSECETARAR